MPSRVEHEKRFITLGHVQVLSLSAITAVGHTHKEPVLQDGLILSQKWDLNSAEVMSLPAQGFSS